MKRLDPGTKVLLGGLLIIVVALIAVGVVAVFTTNDAITDPARSDLSHTATGLALGLQGVMSEQFVTARVVATSTSVMVAADAVESGAARARAAVLPAQQEIERIKKANGERLDALVLIGADGVCFASTDDGALVGTDLSQRAYFKTAMQGAANVGEVLISLVTGRKVVIAASPIYDASGTRVTGVVSLGMDREDALNALGRIKLGETGYVFVVDASGLYLQHPVKENVLKVDITQVRGMESLAQAVGQKRDAVVTYTLGGVQHLAAVRRVPVTGWSVVATAPQSELHAPAVHTRNVIIIVSAVAVLLAALVFFIFARAFRRSPTASSQ